MKHLHLLLLSILYINIMAAHDTVIRNGVPWYDSDGNVINAHGACIVEDGGCYWLFGEYKADGSNAFPGFGCYSSDDLVNWKFERVVLPVQPDGILGPDRVGERVKVMRCPSTGEYIMLMHADNLKYSDPHIGIAVSDRINGDYRLLGSIEHDGQPIKKWDMGTFQDADGTGYLLIHHGPIYRLSDDYRSIAAQVANVEGMGESPAMFCKDGTYYLLSSGLTSWERNDNFYFTAPAPEGPWEKRGYFCPEGTLTYNSQCTFVFSLRKGDDIIPMYMGDRWSFPLQASAATYVWLPMEADGDRLSIPAYWQAWDVATVRPLQCSSPEVSLPWRSNLSGDSLSIPFKGEGISIYGTSDAESGYAAVTIRDGEGEIVQTAIIDFYSKVPDTAPRFVSRKFPKADYTAEIKVTGEHPVWHKKNGTRFGSNDYYITVTGYSIY